MNYKNERYIVYNKDPKYFRILRLERLYKTLTYFHQVNKWLVDPRDLEESRIFNSSDLYYLKTLDINKQKNDNKN